MLVGHQIYVPSGSIRYNFATFCSLYARNVVVNIDDLDKQITWEYVPEIQMKFCPAGCPTQYNIDNTCLKTVWKIFGLRKVSIMSRLTSIDNCKNNSKISQGVFNADHNYPSPLMSKRCHKARPPGSALSSHISNVVLTHFLLSAALGRGCCAQWPQLERRGAYN